MCYNIATGVLFAHCLPTAKQPLLSVLWNTRPVVQHQSTEFVLEGLVTSEYPAMQGVKEHSSGKCSPDTAGKGCSDEGSIEPTCPDEIEKHSPHAETPAMSRAVLGEAAAAIFKRQVGIFCIYVLRLECLTTASLPVGLP